VEETDARPLPFTAVQELAVRGRLLLGVARPADREAIVLTVIGVLMDSSPEFMAGVSTSQATLAPVFGDRVLPTTHLFALQPGVA
jgi:hypothetical protein